MWDQDANKWLPQQKLTPDNLLFFIIMTLGKFRKKSESFMVIGCMVLKSHLQKYIPDRVNYPNYLSPLTDTVEFKAQRTWVLLNPDFSDLGLLP